MRFLPTFYLENGCVFKFWISTCQLRSVQMYLMKLLNLTACILLITSAAFSQTSSEILAFNAEKINDAIAISWTPSDEAATNHFEIQRSQDGMNWKVVAIMFPFEDISEAHSYRYSDKTFANENSYYRIRQIETSKKEKFSKVMMVEGATARK